MKVFNTPQFFFSHRGLGQTGKAEDRAMSSWMKSLVISGCLATSMVWVVGCSALMPHKFCEQELAETQAKLAQTSQLANNLSLQLKQQRAELEKVKRVNAANVRREKEQAMLQIDAKREQL